LPATNTCSSATRTALPLAPSGWTQWSKQIAHIRARGINNRLVATEWGGPTANNGLRRVPGGNYPQEFHSRIITPDPSWAGLMWFEALYDPKISYMGLFDPSGTMLTPPGQNYAAKFVP
jgi:hypothetical protein